METKSPVFLVHHDWSKVPELLVWRIARIVVDRMPAGWAPENRPSGSAHWFLSSNLAWTLHVLPAGCGPARFRLEYKHGRSPEFWAALKTVIEGILQNDPPFVE